MTDPNRPPTIKAFKVEYQTARGWTTAHSVPAGTKVRIHWWVSGAGPAEKTIILFSDYQIIGHAKTPRGFATISTKNPGQAVLRLVARNLNGETERRHRINVVGINRPHQHQPPPPPPADGPRTPYEVLGLKNGTAPAEVKVAYRTLAMKHHPDKGGDATRFRDVQEAYDIIVKGTASSCLKTCKGCWRCGRAPAPVAPPPPVQDPLADLFSGIGGVTITFRQGNVHTVHRSTNIYKADSIMRDLNQVFREFDLGDL